MKIQQNVANIANCYIPKFDKIKKVKLDNLIDFEKCWKTRIYLQKSAPIQPKTSNILPKCCQKLLLPRRLPPGAPRPRAPRRGPRRHARRRGAAGRGRHGGARGRGPKTATGFLITFCKIHFALNTIFCKKKRRILATCGKVSNNCNILRWYKDNKVQYEKR